MCHDILCRDPIVTLNLQQLGEKVTPSLCQVVVPGSKGPGTLEDRIRVHLTVKIDKGKFSQYQSPIIDMALCSNENAMIRKAKFYP